MPLAIFLRKIFKIDIGWSMRSGLDRYTLHESVGKIGNLVSGSGLRVFRCLSVYLGGEHWTDTLLFRFNLHRPQTLFGLSPIVIGRGPCRFILRLMIANRLVSIVRCMCFSRPMRLDVSMSVESIDRHSDPTLRIYLNFPFRSTLRIS